MRYVDRDNNEITLQQWTDLQADRRVAVTEVNDCTVSTIWLGLDVGDEGIFETLIVRRSDTDFEVIGSRRYPTEVDAVVGHLECVRDAS